MREHVVAASKAMKKGDWKQCKDYILAVKVKQQGYIPADIINHLQNSC